MRILFVRLMKLIGLVTVAVAILIAVLIAWPPPDMPVPGLHADVLIRNVRVIDVVAGTASSEQNVLIRDGRIASIAPPSQIPTPVGVTEIEAQGKFLSPALWDMHTHSNTFDAQYQRHHAPAFSALVIP